jgi:hypothetical protein
MDFGSGVQAIHVIEDQVLTLVLVGFNVGTERLAVAPDQVRWFLPGRRSVIVGHEPRQLRLSSSRRANHHHETRTSRVS